MRTKHDIAADLEAAESTLKSAQKSIVQATAKIAGTTLAPDLPDIEKIPMFITLPDGRQITLGQLAEEIRNLP